MARVTVGPTQGKIFHRMFKSAQRKHKPDGELDGIVNQWMICEARKRDEEAGDKNGPIERSLKGIMISPRYYLY